MNYFMKKAGKDVAESSEISMSEEDQKIPVVEGSHSSKYSSGSVIGMVAAKTKKSNDKNGK